MLQFTPRNLARQSVAPDCAPQRRPHCAANQLRDTFPQLSASWGPNAAQMSLLALACILIGLSATATPGIAGLLSLVLFLLPFSCLVVLRLALLANVPSACAAQLSSTTGLLNNDRLPTYTVLVALYHEVEVVPQLVAALARLDYPPYKLQILLVTELSDESTRSALAAAGMAPFMRILTVPPCEVRTKPNALNYALQEATGELVVIYDAEDEPDPDQLRRAASAFAACPDALGCVQAQLRIHNFDRSWLTRLFATEYAALFGCILPALERLGCPIPLGGTSNHFPRAVLCSVGGWDPYNVTEDADLGIRLARFGFGVRVLTSTTWEEAPPTFSAWFNQRTRWLKGWTQTLIVHTRQPRVLLAELGLLPGLALVTLMGTMVLSALIQPFFLAYCLWLLVVGPPPAMHDLIWTIGLLNGAVGYATGLWIAGIAAWRTREPALLRSLPWLPLYWLLISVAAYRACFELVRRPYFWHKTPHLGRNDPMPLTVPTPGNLQ